MEVSSTVATLGWVGLGLMGRRMAPRLALGRHRVLVWNRSREPLAELKERGLEPVSLPSFSQVRAAFIMVRDHAAVEEVLDAGLEKALRKNTILVNLSTIGPEAARAEARRLAEKGIRYVEAPVSGSLSAAEDGTLVILAGGEPKDLDDVRPYLLLLGREVRHVGPVGHGNAAKLVLNHLLALTVGALAEAVTLGERLGLTPEALRELLAEHPIVSTTMRQKLPSLLADAYEPPQFKLELMRKDVDLALAGDGSLPLAEAARALYAKAEEAGAGGLDFAAVRLALSGGLKGRAPARSQGGRGGPRPG
jgi:3-hydroxyisobutyrate dehydrogenase